MLIYDFVSKQASGIDTRKLAKGQLKWQAAVSLAGKVYGNSDSTCAFFISYNIEIMYDRIRIAPRNPPFLLLPVQSSWCSGKRPLL